MRIVRPLFASGVALLLASGARAQCLDAAVSPAMAKTRAAVAGQKRLAQAAAADGASATSPRNDDDLKQALRDIALRACTGGEIASAELYALPAPSNAAFLDGPLPEGLSFGNCAGKLYFRLGLKLVHGESVSLDDVASHGPNEIPAVAAPAPVPVPVPVAPTSPSPAPAAPPPAVGAPNGRGAPAAPPSVRDGEAVARRSLERQNRELQKYDGIVRGADGRRRRDRDRDRDRRR